MKAVFDEESLREECDNDKELLAKMYEIFTRDTDVRLPKLRTAIETGDAVVVNQEAHALKGSVGTFYAVASFETAYKLETMGAQAELTDAKLVFAEFETELQNLRQELERIIRE